MLTYQDFCTHNAFDKAGKNTDAMRLFDYLCHPETIHNMIVFSEVGLPAFSGIAKGLEETFADAPLFPLSKLPNRQVAGKMAKFILSHFGYEPLPESTRKHLKLNVKLREFSRAKLFGQSTIYAKTGREVCYLDMQIKQAGNALQTAVGQAAGRA